MNESDPKLGRKGEVVKVARGFAANFLIPHGKARLATPSAVKALAVEKARRDKQEAKRLAEAKETASRLEGLSLTIQALSGEEDKLHGAVTAQDIQEALAQNGIRVDKKEIQLEEPIHRLGVHAVSVRLCPELTATLKVQVVKKKA